MAHRGNWRSLQRSSSFFAWAGNTFELLCINHQRQLCNKLRIATLTNSYCWSGMTPDGKGAQIDLLLEWDGERTDYLCEMKFSETKYTVSRETEDNIQNKIEAFLASKQHKPSHSLQVVLVTSFGLRDRRDVSCINAEVTLDDLFAVE